MPRGTPTKLERRLREIREAAGLSKCDLAARLGFTEGAVRHIESGRNQQRPTVDTVIRWAAACGYEWQSDFMLAPAGGISRPDAVLPESVEPVALDVLRHSIGHRVRALRQSRGLSQRDLAGDSLSPQMVSFVERGEGNPTLSMLHRIADMLDANLVVALVSRDTDTLDSPAETDDRPAVGGGDVSASPPSCSPEPSGMPTGAQDLVEIVRSALTAPNLTASKLRLLAAMLTEAADEVEP